MLNKMITHFTTYPKHLFVLDGIGALLSAFLLGYILVELETIFGIPKSTLYLLAAFPLIFALVDFYSYHKKKIIVTKFMGLIACMNMLYCGLSLLSAIYHQQTITVWGISYISGEIIIVMILALTELKVMNKLKIAEQ